MRSLTPNISPQQAFLSTLVKEGNKDVGKPPKTPKATGKDSSWDMLFYAQKLGVAGQTPNEDLGAAPAIFHTAQEEEQLIQGPSAAIDQPLTDTEEWEGEEETEQPTLAEILRAVHKCTASVNTLKEHFGGLKEEMSLIGHDIRKIKEWTMAAKG